MKVSLSRILKLEQLIEAHLACKRDRDEVQKKQAGQLAAEWEKYIGLMSREEYETWKQSEQEYHKRLLESGREKLPVSRGPVVSQETMDRRTEYVLARRSTDAQERYVEHHGAYEAVFWPRYVVRALQVTGEDRRWGGLADRMRLLGKVEAEVSRELGFDSWGRKTKDE